MLPIPKVIKVTLMVREGIQENNLKKGFNQERSGATRKRGITNRNKLGKSLEVSSDQSHFPVHSIGKRGTIHHWVTIVRIPAPASIRSLLVFHRMNSIKILFPDDIHFSTVPGTKVSK